MKYCRINSVKEMFEKVLKRGVETGTLRVTASYFKYVPAGGPYLFFKCYLMHPGQGIFMKFAFFGKSIGLC